MKNNLILDKLDQTIQPRQTGVDIDFGEVRMIWELAYTQIQEYFTGLQKNKVEVGNEGLEMLAKLNQLIIAFFARFPKRVERLNYVPPMIQPSWPPKEQKTYIPYPTFVPDYLQGWRLDTGKEPPPTTYTTSTKWEK